MAYDERTNLTVSIHNFSKELPKNMEINSQPTVISVGLLLHPFDFR